MTTKDDDLKVTIADDPLDLPIDVDIITADPEKKAEAAPKREVAVEKAEPDNEAIESLRRQLEEARAEAQREREAKAAALAKAHEFETKSQTATTNKLASDLDSVDSALALTETQMSQAKKNYAAALEIADYDAAAKAQQEMTQATIDKQRLEYGKSELAKRIKTAREEPAPKAAPPRVDEYVDGIMANSSVPARTYIARNRGSLTSEKAVKRMIAAHNLAVNSDIAPDTDDYFAFIDSQMGWGEKTEDAAPATKAAPAAKRSYSAPVSRDTARANGDLSGKTVTLTREQAELAREMGLSPAAYAKNLMKIRANGKDPNADGLRFTADKGV